MWNVMGWNEAVLEGGRSLWRDADIIGLVESWESEDSGDFNARTDGAQGEALPALESSVWERGTTNQWSRESADTGRNGFTHSFLQLLSVTSLTILNGVDRFRDTRDFTCITWNGQSTVDYLLASDNARERVSHFNIGSILPESDHKPLLCSLTGFEVPTKLTKLKRGKLIPKPLRERRLLYEQELSSRLVSQVTSSDALHSVISQAAKVAFSWVKRSSKTWFDLRCWLARDRALRCVPEDRQVAHREYRNYIRGRKREFTRLQQEVLTEELLKTPQIFWQRLRMPSEPMILEDASIYDYASGLLFFPEAMVMPSGAESAISYVYHTRLLDQTRLPALARLSSLDKGWYADLCGWAASWGFPETSWDDEGTLRSRLFAAAVSKMWVSPTPRQSHYLKDIDDITPYLEKPYLQFPLQRKWNERSLWTIGFTRLETLWNERKNSRGRGFGGVGVWVRDGSGLRVEVEKTDCRKQFLCLRLFTKNCATPAFLFVAYYAPLGAPIYQRLGSGEDPLSALTEAVIAVHELGPVWVVGDFNSRVGDAQSLELNEEGVAAWRNSDADESWCRSAEDEGWNGMSEFFMQFAAAGGLTIINGTAPFPDTWSVTCRTHNASSTVDFLLACKSARDRILDFSFGPFSPESDHCPLRCTLMGFEREIRRQDRRSKVGVCLDVTKRNQYETTLVNKLHGRELTSGTLPNIITGIAKEVFTAKQPRDKGWFDDDCRVARSKAMSAVDQRAAFRQYNHFIRARKRRFLRQH
ncbi:hypothetical protein R1sor_007348 [Riccia sorocarpa]|uniref:Endonuclease/exonuclease/phosphatase domain-containing protein n=1 Tax=Riccia sorocarpa TaxID=122646 RepID=A0ABD3HT46_9MARC